MSVSNLLVGVVGSIPVYFSSLVQGRFGLRILQRRAPAARGLLDAEQSIRGEAGAVATQTGTVGREGWGGAFDGFRKMGARCGEVFSIGVAVFLNSGF